MAPCANESNRASACHVVVFGVDVEPADLFDVASGGVLGQAGDVEHADAGAVVGECGEAVFDVEVVVDRLHFVLVVAGDLGRFEGAEVPL